MFNISRFQGAFPRHMEIHRNILSVGVRMLLPLADTEDALMTSLREMIEAHRITSFDTNIVASLYSWTMTHLINNRQLYEGDSIPLTFTDLEQLTFLSPTRISYQGTQDEEVASLCEYDIEDADFDTFTFISNGEPQYLIAEGLNCFTKKIGETANDYYEIVTIEGLDTSGEPIREDVRIVGNDLYNLANSYQLITSVSHPLTATTGMISISQGKPDSIAPPIKRTWFDAGQKIVYVSIDTDYSDGLQLSYKIMPDVSDTEYDSLYKCYLADSNGVFIEPVSFTLTEKDECFVLDSNSNIHYFSTLWPDLQFPTPIKSQNPYTQILLNKMFYEFDEPADVYVTTSANSDKIKNFSVKLVDPEGDIEYLQADHSLGDTEHIFYDTPPSIVFRFSPVRTGTYQIVSIVTDIDNELHYNQAYAIVVGLAADISFATESSYLSIRTGGENKLLLGAPDSSQHVYQLHYDYIIITGTNGLLAVEEYQTLVKV